MMFRSITLVLQGIHLTNSTSYSEDYIRFEIESKDMASELSKIETGRVLSLLLMLISESIIGFSGATYLFFIGIF